MDIVTQFQTIMYTVDSHGLTRVRDGMTGVLSMEDLVIRCCYNLGQS